MTYSRKHRCSYRNCKVYRSYIRIKHKWVVVGEYGTECQSFITLWELNRSVDALINWRL